MDLVGNLQSEWGCLPMSKRLYVAIGSSEVNCKREASIVEAVQGPPVATVTAAYAVPPQLQIHPASSTPPTTA